VADPENDGAVGAVRDLLWGLARTLEAKGARDEALAEFVPAHRVLGIPRQAALKPVGRVWRLGVLLLDREGLPRATGGITRAVPPGHPGHVAVSAEQRREVRAAAFRGRFPPGETVNYDTQPIELTAASLTTTTGPLFLADGKALVRWSVSAPDEAAAGLEPYLRERVDLLLHPPQGAT
jgi:hypothetical protein